MTVDLYERPLTPELDRLPLENRHMAYRQSQFSIFGCSDYYSSILIPAVLTVPRRSANRHPEPFRVSTQCSACDWSGLYRKMFSP